MWSVFQYECGMSSAVVAIGNGQQGELAGASGSRGAGVSKITDVNELKKQVSDPYLLFLSPFVVPLSSHLYHYLPSPLASVYSLAYTFLLEHSPIFSHARSSAWAPCQTSALKSGITLQMNGSVSAGLEV